MGVSVASVVKWSQRLRATGSTAAKPVGNRRPRFLMAERDWLLARLAAVPDLTLRALVVELRERGVVTSYGSVWRTVRDALLSLKRKTLFATEQDRPDVARQRQRWKAHQGNVDPARLVFIDETWAKTNMTRLRGWSRRGAKLLAKFPHGHRQTLTFLRPCAMTASMRRWYLTGRAMVKASWLGSSKCWSRRWRQATS